MSKVSRERYDSFVAAMARFAAGKPNVELKERDFFSSGAPPYRMGWVCVENADPEAVAILAILAVEHEAYLVFSASTRQADLQLSRLLDADEAARPPGDEARVCSSPASSFTTRDVA